MTTKLNNALVRPEVETNKRTLHIVTLADCSVSMGGKPIAVLNNAKRESISELKTEAQQHPEVDFLYRCIAFSSTARWHIGPDPIKINNVSWVDLNVGGCTSTGAAVGMLTDAVTEDKMPERGLAPVMVLISDGGNTDGAAYDRAIDQLNKELWGAKAIRLSIGIGDHYNRAQLEKFTNHPEIGVLEAKNAVDLLNYIRYATVTATIASSMNLSDPGNMTTNISLPPAPKPSTSDANNIMLSAR